MPAETRDIKNSKRVQKKEKEGKFKERQGVYDEGDDCTRDSKITLQYIQSCSLYQLWYIAIITGNKNEDKAIDAYCFVCKQVGISWL